MCCFIFGFSFRKKKIEESEKSEKKSGQNIEKMNVWQQ